MVPMRTPGPDKVGVYTRKGNKNKHAQTHTKREREKRLSELKETPNINNLLKKHD